MTQLTQLGHRPSPPVSGVGLFKPSFHSTEHARVGPDHSGFWQGLREVAPLCKAILAI